MKNFKSLGNHRDYFCGLGVGQDVVSGSLCCITSQPPDSWLKTAIVYCSLQFCGLARWVFHSSHLCSLVWLHSASGLALLTGPPFSPSTGFHPMGFSIALWSHGAKWMKVKSARSLEADTQNHRTSILSAWLVKANHRDGSNLRDGEIDSTFSWGNGEVSLQGGMPRW